MKKIMLIALAILSLSVHCLSQRKVVENNHLVILAKLQDEKVKIKKDELPEIARKTLDGDAFKGWVIVNVYRLKNGEHEVELKKGDTTQTLKFDKDGKVK